ncbi:MAG: DUF1294 domain-containing protein [Methylococcaceae bacterium]|nr:DUF1294 domain-containing protein [Methylococcaceae bacterium]
MQIYEGKIKSWKADKGFGFIQSRDEDKDIFIHIRDLKHSNYQPQQGDEIYYKVVADQEGRIRAYDAFIKGQELSNLYRKKSFKQKNRASLPKKHITRRAYNLGKLLLLFIACIPFVFSVLLIKEHRNVFPLFIYLLMSLATFFVYAIDKTKAHKNETRISEKTLHLFELLGGWPGALITQRVIRHKNKKISFQVIFWIIVIIHIAIWFDVLFFNSAVTGLFLCSFYSFC